MFTYEEKDTGNVRETYEWDNIWWEHCENTTTPRLLAIGDSISCGWRTALNKYYDGRIYVDGFGSSKALDNPFILPGIKLMASQMPQCSAVLCNNGLHGFHLSDEAYEAEYEKFISALLAEFPKQKFFLLLTTPVRNGKNLAEFMPRTEIVKRRNAAALRIAKKHSLPVIDLFTPLAEHPDLFSQDGVHLTLPGYDLIAKIIAEAVGL